MIAASTTSAISPTLPQVVFSEPTTAYPFPKGVTATQKALFREDVSSKVLVFHFCLPSLFRPKPISVAISLRRFV